MLEKKVQNEVLCTFSVSLLISFQNKERKEEKKKKKSIKPI